MLRHHGHLTGVWAFGRWWLSNRLLDRADRRSRCPGGLTCWKRHQVEHAAWRAARGLPMTVRER